jgi:putative autotransporter adhesin-like protein
MLVRTLGSLAATLTLLLLAPSCTRVQGPPVSQTRDVEPFQSIELRGGATIDVLVGEKQSVVVQADGEGLDELRTRVADGTLVIDTQSRFFWMRNPEVKVRITVPELQRLVANGAVKASLNGYAGGETALVLSGAGDIEASGTVDTLRVMVNGAGNLDLRHLAARDARVVVNGTGSVEIDASDRLDATVNGVGNIRYQGKPKMLNTAIHGVGSIGPR